VPFFIGAGGDDLKNLQITKKRRRRRRRRVIIMCPQFSWIDG
jgi:hypothetical protein